jgi:hypothetical protein
MENSQKKTPGPTREYSEVIGNDANLLLLKTNFTVNAHVR